jgi:DNA-binding PadR family transcriptional regulator
MIDRDFVRGFVKLYALSLASDGDVYGMKILEEMKQARIFVEPRHFVSSTPCVTARRGRDCPPEHCGRKMRKCYRLTAKGRRELEEIKQRLRTLVRSFLFFDAHIHCVN